MREAGPELQAVETLLRQGRKGEARTRLAAVVLPAADGVVLHDAAQLWMHLQEPARAAELYVQAVDLVPGNGAWRYNLSTALIALGRMEEAETALDRVLADNPRDWDAWYNRATLRRQTPERNHVAELRRMLATPGLDAAAAVPLGYGLAKELEDLGEWEASFAALRQGADARRGLLSYDVAADVAIMRAITEAFPAAPVQLVGDPDPHPVFVVGLPRSGTTLVERMLSSHSAIASHGESADFALALMETAGPCANKEELLQRSATLDPAALGAAYLARIAHVEGARVVDKTPANFLYLGLIARALPQARIVYVRRGAMDVCYAMYKTLFRMAYPYSYDLDDLASYWLAFDGMMRHWQVTIPATQLLTVDYEAIVADPEQAARRLVAHVGLPWDEACLHFERNPLPSLTASAAQVRQPVYRSSVGRWRRYERQLAPLAARLAAAGVEIDQPEAAEA